MERGKWSHSIALLILRLGVGGLLVTHGWGKVQMVLAGDFANFGDPIGIGPTASLILVTAAEFLGSICVMLGFATRFAALSVVIAMSVAIFVAHAADPWSMETAFKAFMAGETKMPLSREPALLYLVPFLALTISGAGAISIDALRGGRRRESKSRQPVPV